MTKKTRLQQLGRTELEALAAKALTNRERSRQSSAKVRQAKKAAGLQQVSVWLPVGSPAIQKVRKYADDVCEQHLASRDAQPVSPSKSNDLQGRCQEPETSENPPRKPGGEKGV